MRATVRSDGFQYWGYVLIYVDDLLVISENPKDILLAAKIDYYYPIKPESIGPSSIYLGAELSKCHLKNGVVAWTMSSSQ